MPRDVQKKYYSVGIPRDSALQEQLEHDAEACRITVAQLIALRIHDWYKGVQPMATVPLPKPEPEVTQAETLAPMVEVEATDEQMLANASALLDDFDL
jgi:hypothetical protein